MEKLEFTLPVFEGPLELLLHLIQKNKVNIYDIPISEITSQYMEYLAAMEEMDLEVTSEFLVMAAQLINIKSRMLLPREPEAEEEDPRQELVERLTEYKKIKEAAEFLKEWEFSSINNFFRRAEKLDAPPPKNPSLPITVLYEAFAQVLERAAAKLPPSKEVFTSITKKERASVKDMVRHVLRIFKNKKRVAFKNIFDGLYEKSELVAAFLAVLHLVERGRAGIQSRGGEIYITLSGTES